MILKVYVEDMFADNIYFLEAFLIQKLIELFLSFKN